MEYNFGRISSKVNPLTHKKVKLFVVPLDTSDFFKNIRVTKKEFNKQELLYHLLYTMTQAVEKLVGSESWNFYYEKGDSSLPQGTEKIVFDEVDNDNWGGEQIMSEVIVSAVVKLSKVESVEVRKKMSMEGSRNKAEIGRLRAKCESLGYKMVEV